jgi:hypothetical protein
MPVNVILYEISMKFRVPLRNSTTVIRSFRIAVTPGNLLGFSNFSS